MEQRHKSNPFKSNFWLFFIVLFVCLIGAELFFRIWYHAHGRIIAANEEELCTKRTYLKLINTSNTWRYEPSETDYFEYWNVSGVRPKANVSQNIIFPKNIDACNIKYRVVFNANINNQHLRAVRDYPLEKANNTLRIAIFGDSFTWGSNALLYHTYPAILEVLLPHSEVLNFGVEGTGLDEMYYRWKYEGIGFTPDVVVFTIYPDDIKRIQPCIYKPTLVRKGNSLFITHFPPPSLQEIEHLYHLPLFESYFLKHLLYTVHYWKGVDTVQFDEGLKIAELLLHEVKTTSHQSNTTFLVLLVERGTNDEVDEEQAREINEMKHLLDQWDIPWISSETLFFREDYLPKDYYNKSVDHFSPTGYAILAQGVKRKLLVDGIITDNTDWSFFWDGDRNLLLMKNRYLPEDQRVILPYEDYLYNNCTDTYASVPVNMDEFVDELQKFTP